MGRRVLHIVSDSLFDTRVSTVSLSFASNEQLANTTDADLGIANAWSILVWFKNPGTDTGLFQRIFTFQEGAGNENRIDFDMEDANPNGDLALQISNSAGTEFKSYKYANQLTIDDWVACIFTWDGTTLQAYFDGVATVPSSTPTDNTGTMTNTVREVWFGSQLGGSDDLTGSIHSVTLWNTALDTNGASLASAVGHNPRSSAYGYRDNLVHWWRMGLPAVDGMAGTTYVCDAVETGGIDVSANAVNITDADIVTDAPA
jgi:hypothetical protein